MQTASDVYSIHFFLWHVLTLWIGEYQLEGRPTSSSMSSLCTNIRWPVLAVSSVFIQQPQLCQTAYAAGHRTPSLHKNDLHAFGLRLCMSMSFCLLACLAAIFLACHFGCMHAAQSLLLPRCSSFVHVHVRLLYVLSSPGIYSSRILFCDNGRGACQLRRAPQPHAS